MNVRFTLKRIRRKIQSRMKLREVLRRTYWLEFENESILNFLAKYNVISDNHKTSPNKQIRAKIQDFVGDEPGFVINVLETSNS